LTPIRESVMIKRIEHRSRGVMMASMWEREPRCRYTDAVIAAERPSDNHCDIRVRPEHELLSGAGSPTMT
jgi:hypothetical protein